VGQSACAIITQLNKSNKIDFDVSLTWRVVDPDEADAPTSMETQNIKKEEERPVYHGIYLCMRKKT